MWKTKLNILIRMCFLVILTSNMSGCLLTDVYKREAIESHKADGFKQKLSEIEDVYTIHELTQKLKEIEVMRNDINRVIALESDLAYLTEIVAGTKKQTESDLGKGLELPSLDTIVDKQDLVGGSSTQSIGAVLTNAFSDTTNVKLASATPIPASIANQQRGNVADSKFSDSLPSAPQTNNRASINSASNNSAGVSDKFSGTQNSNASSLSDQCFQSAGGATGNFSVHLASYKSSSNAAKGWSSLFEKHKAILCQLTPKLADVNANGQQFLSLRVGPLRDRASAVTLCSLIKAKGDYCASAEFMGRPL